MYLSNKKNEIDSISTQDTIDHLDKRHLVKKTQAFTETLPQVSIT